jgi:hypothetical protein
MNFMSLCLLSAIALSTSVFAAPDPTGCDVLDPAPLNNSVEYASVIQPIFTGSANQAARCTTCHAPSTSGSLSLADSASHAQLVGVNSSQDPSIQRVVPFDAAGSLLFRKINCTSPGVGSRMPRNRPAISLEEQRLIRDWINQGALLVQAFFGNGFE